MTTFFQAVKAALIADVTLGTLTTIIKDDDDVPQDGLKRRDLLASASSPNISPAIFIKWRTNLPFDALIFSEELVFFETYFYQQKGYTTCEAMRNRVLALLHQQAIQFDGGFCMEIYWVGDVRRSYDGALGGVSMERSRYEARITRG